MKKYDKKTIVIFLVSILLHLIVFLIWFYLKPNEPEAVVSKIMTVKLTSPIEDIIKEEVDLSGKPLDDEEPEPEPEPEPETAIEEMMPIDNADTFSSNNQSDKSKDKIVFGAENAENIGEKLLKKEAVSNEKQQKTAIETREEFSNIDEQAVTEITPVDLEQKIENKIISTLEKTNIFIPVEQLIENTNEIDYEGASKDKASSIKPDYYDYFSGIMEQEGDELSQSETVLDDVIYEPGNVELLGDKEMSEVVVEQPFSELESKELKLVNAFLDRMNKQVLAVWSNPYKGLHIYRGTVKLELNDNGYLQDVYVYRASGHPALDASVIKAIRAVVRFEVPENKILAARYYTNLRFYYSSVENKTELMPFQEETETEKEK